MENLVDGKIRAVRETLRKSFGHLGLRVSITERIASLPGYPVSSDILSDENYHCLGPDAGIAKMRRDEKQRRRLQEIRMRADFPQRVQVSNGFSRVSFRKL